jgi:DNA replication and repair protein RecF
MYLTSLSLTNYRLFNRLEMDVPRRIVLLVGNNAQGKTSILEAIYFLATFTSFHTASDRQLIKLSMVNESQPFAKIVAYFRKGKRLHNLEVRLILELNGMGGTRLRKRILVDGVQRKEQEALGLFNAVIFLPQMMEILEGGPEVRRDYLNTTISQVSPDYVRNLGDYNQALTQRNALLKMLFERGGNGGQLDAWDLLLAKNGAKLILMRIQATNELKEYARRFHERLTHHRDVLQISYQPAYDPAALYNGQRSLIADKSEEVNRSKFTFEQVEQGFLQRLKAVRADEIDRGVTTIGPHRDDFRMFTNTVDLGDYGSRGQVRTALLALKLAEVSWLKDKTGEWPVLLLDETLAELDIERRADLLATLVECDQALLTTTDLHLFTTDFVERCEVWKVEKGRATKAEEADSV